MVDCKRMTQTKKTLTLGKMRQLIDLNGDSTNFDLSFNVTCKDDTPYNILIVDQTTLDNTPELQYKEVKNSISGKIVADKNVYQNHFLILKSDTPCVVDVELEKNVLPKTPSGPIEPGNENSHSSKPRRTITESPSKSIPWKKIGLISFVVIIGLGMLWWLYKRKAPESVHKPLGDNTYALGKENFNMSPEHSFHVQSPPNLNILDKKTIPVHVSPSQSSGDHRGYIPNKKTYATHSFKHTSISPDLTSQVSHGSSKAEGNSLLHRLRKFAR